MGRRLDFSEGGVWREAGGDFGQTYAFDDDDDDDDGDDDEQRQIS